MLDSLKSWTSPPALTDGLFPKRLPAKIFHGGVTHVETRDLRQLQDAKKLAVTNLYRNIYKDKDKVKHRVGKCHGYDGYIRVKKMGSWGKKFRRPK